jgi:hypothetical protein
MKTEYYYWVKGIRMTEEQYHSLTSADYDEMRKFWAGCMTKEQANTFVAKYPYNWPDNKRTGSL